MSVKESQELALARWAKVHTLQQAYPHFTPFLQDMMTELGFGTTEIQSEIGQFLEHGPEYLMVQAQRGQAKTTITAIFAVWCLIHNPKWRVLIVSAGSTQATEISTLIVKLILSVDILESMRPDRNNGDRTSVEAFDLHYSLKGVDKSPSVACVGITSNLQGKRADLLIADDVESLKNSQTAVMRAQLLNITRDFSSICSDGRIIYLGTPQSIESIYNTLPASGFVVRIWPGRVPNKTQLKHYGKALAPSIARRAEQHPESTEGHGMDGKQGAPTDTYLTDEILLKKELAQGQAFFQLQHMLLTALTDAMRFPLKTENLIAMRLDGENLPLKVVRSMNEQTMKQWSVDGRTFLTSTALSVSQETASPQGRILYIDPAGGGINGDESAYAVVDLLNSNLYIQDLGGVPGGHDPDKLAELASKVVQWRPTVIKIEKNMGFGLFREVIQPVIKAACELAGVPMPAIEDDLVTGQKEARIIGTIEPVLGRGSLVINEEILARESESVSRYDIKTRITYSFLFQLATLTRDKNSLKHDDRLDALEGAVRHFSAALAVDQTKAIEALKQRELAAFISNPLSLPSHILRQLGQKPAGNSFQKRVRHL
jgi:hypothetical protein